MYAIRSYYANPDGSVIDESLSDEIPKEIRQYLQSAYNHIKAQVQLGEYRQ